jgi:uncharacterized spore protein YtfJ
VHPDPPNPEVDMQLDSLIHEIGETIQREASVKTVFGDPIKLDEHTVIPVALVTVSFGGGLGGGHGTAARLLGKDAPNVPGSDWTGGGGGGGLNIVTLPIGFLSEREGQVTFNAIGGAGEGAVQLNPIVRKFLDKLGRS